MMKHMHSRHVAERLRRGGNRLSGFAWDAVQLEFFTKTFAGTLLVITFPSELLGDAASLPQSKLWTWYQDYLSALKRRRRYKSDTGRKSRARSCLTCYFVTTVAEVWVWVG
ncbi:hypothetical protein CC2G_003101 [Coprinopsis cinerea AmutBmut pab1-1]|nr:hypothetical protein CC2G_003101 [Coprinopsis cinerea AmutBmut pab1-1]